MTPQRIQHLLRQFRQHRGIVLPINHEAVSIRAHTSFDIRHRADRGPIFPQLIHRHVMPQTFPHVIGSHALAHHIRVIGRNVKEAARANRFIVHQRDISDRRPDARTQQSEPLISLLLQPPQTSPRILHRLPIRLKRQPNIRPADLVRAFVPVGHAPVVIRHAHLYRGNSQPLNPFAKPPLSMPLGIPVRQHQHGRPIFLPWKNLCVDNIVFRPRRLYGTGKRKHILPVHSKIGRRSRGKPLMTRLNRMSRILAQEFLRIRLRSTSVNMLEPPFERLHPPIVISSPPAMLIPPNFAFKPAHKIGSVTGQSPAYSCIAISSQKPARTSRLLLPDRGGLREALARRSAK
jgi:hypothetical protein